MKTSNSKFAATPQSPVFPPTIQISQKRNNKPLIRGSHERSGLRPLNTASDSQTSLGGTTAKRVPVCFDFTDPTATTVCIAGTFNNWKPEKKNLRSSSTGHWWKEIALAPGTYEYCLVVDGHWIPDPSARDSVANPFGGRNSILKVFESSEAAHLDDAEHIPMKSENQ